MPDAHAVIEQCKWLISKGRGNESLHLTVWPEEMKKRREKKDRTKFAKELDSHDLYVSLNEEWDRIIKHVGVKAIAIEFIVDWMKELKGPVLDKFMAARESPK